MNEQEISEKIKIGLKSPSSDFTDKVMAEVTTLNHKIPVANRQIFRRLLIACCGLLVFSIFISIPGIHILNYSIGFSPAIMPIISLIFIFIILHQLYDLRKLITNDRQNNVVQHQI